ncbi:MAG: ferredoxin, partial [Gemmatimonadetes bacterium]|nr:ferredoxin [Gemmatimonadota bacterium]
AEFARVYAMLADFPLAKTAPFFDAPEARQAGAGGLLSITVNPEACKGCNLCVEVCPDGALITVKQDEDVVEKLRRNWKLWERLPDTADRYISIASLEEGIGALPSLLLKKANYRSMVGGDGACMGCGEKTVVHLVVAAIEALMRPRVARHVERLNELIAQLDRKARELLAADADLEAAAGAAGGRVVMPLDAAKQKRLDRMTGLIEQLKDLRWRYTEGPSGRGRANLGMTNATGCSSVWGSTYPYNPYPFPWVNHLFQDAPSVAIGIFEAHMRKMAAGFLAIRRAELELADAYDAAVHEAQFTAFDWKQFSEEEFALCPPIIAMGGDGAMLDIGFQNLSRLMASGKPIRVVVLDTQVYSNTGGQACTSGYTGQVSDMAAWGAAQHGKQEMRKELSLVALAHRGVFVHQSSQAMASHLLAGVLKGLQSRRPAIFNLYTPCPVEHGLADDMAQHAARLALESRAFPFLTFDPDAGAGMAECLSLDGNPAVDQDWPTYELHYREEGGEEKTLELPLTIADWAATEARFKKHFKTLPPDADPDALVPFHDYLELPAAEREGKIPFLYVLREGRLERLRVSVEMVQLGEERRLFWAQLRELAGIRPAASVREAIADQLAEEFEAKAAALRAEYEAKLKELKATLPPLVARRLAEGLLRADRGQTLGDLLSRIESLPPLPPVAERGDGAGAARPAATAGAAPALASAPAAVAVASASTPEAEEALAIEPYIDAALCTTCNECTTLNAKMFAYDAYKQAYIKDARAGTFAQLVTAAERCPVRIIHPGTPLNPKEKDLAKWLKRAEPFN